MTAEGGMEGIRRIGLAVRAEPDGGDRTLDVVASTEALDAHGTVLRGWNLERYKRAPVVLWNHRRNGSGGEDLPIGHSEDIRLEGAALRMRVRLVDAKAHPLAEMVWHGARQGSIRGVSVGFGPTAKTSIREETRDGVRVDVIEGIELLEVSLVPVPSNPEAVIESVRALRDDVRRVVAARPRRLPYTPEGVRAFLTSLRGTLSPEQATASAAELYGISQLEVERIAHAHELAEVRRTARVDGLAEWAVKAGLVRTQEEARALAEPADTATRSEAEEALARWAVRAGLARTVEELYAKIGGAR